MFGCWLVASLSAALASEPPPQVSSPGEIELVDFRVRMRKQIHDRNLMPYVTTGGAVQPKLVATLDGRPLRHAELARLLGDEERAGEIERMAARDKRMLYGSTAATAGVIALVIVAPPSLVSAAAALTLAGTSLALGAPALVPGPKRRATRYSAEEIALRSSAISSADGE